MQHGQRSRINIDAINRLAEKCCVALAYNLNRIRMLICEYPQLSTKLVFDT